MQEIKLDPIKVVEGHGNRWRREGQGEVPRAVAC